MPLRSTSSCPELDGWAVLRELKADTDLRSIPVVLVTVLGDREMGYALGAADYLTKPIDPDALLRRSRAASMPVTVRSLFWSSMMIR